MAYGKWRSEVQTSSWEFYGLKEREMQHFLILLHIVIFVLIVIVNVNHYLVS